MPTPNDARLLIESDAVVVSDALVLKAANPLIESAAVDDSMMNAVTAPPPPATKYQPNDPLFVELLPAYQVVSRLYALTPVMVK